MSGSTVAANVGGMGVLGTAVWQAVNKVKAKITKNKTEQFLIKSPLCDYMVA